LRAALVVLDGFAVLLSSFRSFATPDRHALQIQNVPLHITVVAIVINLRHGGNHQEALVPEVLGCLCRLLETFCQLVKLTCDSRRTKLPGTLQVQLS
jgi:hypothetical protein